MEDFYTLHNKRRVFRKENSDKDHIIFDGNCKVLVSAPHGVSQIRLGRKKACEVGSLTTALFLKNNTNCFLIAKTRNNFDDANFDKVSPYKDDLIKCIKENNIKFLIDIHGLAEKRGIDINFGTNLGFNVSANEKAFNELYNKFKENGFVVSIDQPFMGGGNAISSYAKKQIKDLFTLQIEINCGITNKKENFERYKVVLSILKNWIENLNK